MDFEFSAAEKAFAEEVEKFLDEHATPDVADVTRARHAALEDETLAIPGAPDLAVEVLSPSNRDAETRQGRRVPCGWHDAGVGCRFRPARRARLARMRHRFAVRSRSNLFAQRIFGGSGIPGCISDRGKFAVRTEGQRDGRESVTDAG